ncbi:hypothetical protein LC612_36725 [Nostoc sp. CHAB 5834]|nr:hypothetical protein [Nostoc sp. CHAB 5834]
MITRTYPEKLNDLPLSPLAVQALEAIKSISNEMPQLVWPGKSKKLDDPTKLSAKKEKELLKLEGLPSLYNMWLSQELQKAGFEAECPVREGLKVTDNQRFDFSIMVEGGKRVMVEVEFGYTASIERNFLKLADAYHHGRSALGVIVLPTKRLAGTIASGVAAFETAARRLKSFHPNTMPVPLLLVGLDHRGARRLDLSESWLPDASCLSANSDPTVLWHVASELRAGVGVREIDLPNALREKEGRVRTKRPRRAADIQDKLF